MAVPKPDYLSRDYASLRDSMLRRAAQVFPEWQPSSEGDFGLVLVELFAYMGDILSYYTDRAQFENYLSTATQRDSVLGIAYLLGYTPNSGSPATGSVTLVTDTGMPNVTVPAGTQITTGRIDALDGPVVFETDAAVTLASNGGSSTAVAVTEGTTERYVKIGESTGVPSQSFLLPHTGVYRNTVRVYVEDVAGSTIINPGANQIKVREWVQVEHLLDADLDTKAFEAQITDDSMFINFGDDINGAIPATGLQVFATYRHGFGALGNLAAGQIRLINDKALTGVKVVRDAVTGVYSSTATIGGSDPESTDSIRYNAPRVYRTQNRAVNEADYREIALGVEGVSKANVLAGTNTSVTVYITGSDGGTPSASLISLVSKGFQGRTLAGTTVTVTAPTFIPLNFGTVGTPVTVNVRSQYANKTVLANVEREIRAYVAGLTFGDSVNVSEVYRRIQDIEGVTNVYIPVLARNDTAQTGVGPITPKAWEVFSVGTLNLSVTGGVA